MSADFDGEFIFDVERDIRENTFLYRAAIEWWNTRFARKVYRDAQAKDIRTCRKAGNRPHRTWGFKYLDKKYWDWDGWDWEGGREPPEIMPNAPVVRDYQRWKERNRHKWFFMTRVRDAMLPFPREKEKWRSVGLEDAARILLVTVIITRPDLHAGPIGLVEKTPWNIQSGASDEGLGRQWAAETFYQWDNDTRQIGLWIDLAAVAWKVMQNHPGRGKTEAGDDLATKINVSVERIRHLPIPNEFQPVLMSSARYVLSHPERFDAAAKSINATLAVKMKPDADGSSHPPEFWLIYLVGDFARESPRVLTGPDYDLWAHRLMLLATIASYPGDLSRFGTGGAIPWDSKHDLQTFGRAWILCDLDGSLREEMQDKAGEHTEHRYGELVDGKRQDVVKRTPWQIRGALGLLVDRLKPILTELGLGKEFASAGVAVVKPALAAVPKEPEKEAEPPTNPRRGRLNKQDSDAKRAHLVATLSQHPSLKDDPAVLAAMVNVSESTARRWLDDEEQKYLESKAANPEPAEE